MTDGLSAAAAEAIRWMMAAGGWTASTVPPVRMLPDEDRYYRELAGGWVAEAWVAYDDREHADDSGWRPGPRGIVTVSAGATFPAAERAIALLGEPGNLASAAQPEFAAAGEEGEVQIADRAELLAVVERAADYLSQVALPWAQAHANLADWLEEMERDALELPSVAGRSIPAMLVAQGRPDEALEQLDRFGGGRDPGQRAFVRRLRAFVADGSVLPESGAELFVPPPPPEFDPSLFEDAGRDAFFAAMEEELRSTSVWSHWKYAGGVALRGIGAVRELLDDEPGRLTFAERRWRSVAYRPEDEAFLAAAFTGAGRPVASRVELELMLRSVGDAEAEAADVVLGGRVVGRLTRADLHADVEALPLGPTAARLTQKPREPRYLLEVQVQADPERASGKAIHPGPGNR